MARDILRRLASVAGVDIVCEDGDGQLTAFFDSVVDSPLMQDPAFLIRLRGEAMTESGACVYRDEADAYYYVQKHPDGWAYVGPMFNSKPDPLAAANYYRGHHIRPEDAHAVRPMTMRQIKDITALAAALLGGSSADEDVFHVKNPHPISDEEEMNRELSELAADDEASREAEEFKHTYWEEEQLLMAAQEGRTEDVIRLTERLDKDSGRLSDRDINHWRAQTIIGITLISRAAIRGGLLPATAYRLSGYYIRKCIAATDRSALSLYRTHAIRDMVDRVARLRGRVQGSAYTAKCMDYIYKHFREKILVEDIAKPMGITPGYLARLFKKETGMTLSEYINIVRVDRAANLLVYSDQSLSDIAAYVHFPTQSYFGKMFKQYKGMTPNEFRRTHQVPEFWGK